MFLWFAVDVILIGYFGWHCLIGCELGCIYAEEKCVDHVICAT